MTTIHAYSDRDYSDRPLPRDVLDALGVPRNIRQGQLFVFAANAASAWRRLSTLGLEPSSGRLLRRVDGQRFVKALIDAGLGKDCAVYARALNSSAVVSIRQETSDLIIDRIDGILHAHQEQEN
jgi:hypothetical protein